MQLFVGTGNRGKLKDFSDFFSKDGISCGGISDLQALLKLSDPIEPAEPYETYRENCFIKLNYYYSWSKTGLPHRASQDSALQDKLATLADDSGLEIAALQGEPGVYSASFGGADLTDRQRCEFVIKKLSGVEDRSARFVSTVVLKISDDLTIEATGVVTGEIAAQSRGENGWGYEPIFIPTGKKLTVAELRDQGEVLDLHRQKALTTLTLDQRYQDWRSSLDLYRSL